MIRNVSTYRQLLRKAWQSAGLIFLALLILPTAASASHIVGGEITYRCLGGNTYEVKLAMYRDCINGNAFAQFDDPASIGIFDANGDLQIHLGNLGQLLIPFNADDTISVSTDCMEGMGGVCVQQTFYIDTLELPFTPGGYQLVYQRCCRNGTLVNIVEPLETGSTWVTTISEAALMECNSSPEYQEWPPIFICVNEEINYDHSAIDADGDSLVYRLCAPLMGSTHSDPLPQPPNFPPYEEVIFAAPYNVENLLGGDALQIDANGQLTGTPNTIGQFLVGVCVEEYRNGQLLSMTRRDFEYNVLDCDGLVFTNFEVETDVVCADVVDVTITDQSIGVTDSSLWIYLVTKENGDVISFFDEPNPSFRVDGTETININQIVVVNDLCTADNSRIIDLGVEVTGVNDNDSIIVCAGSSVQLNPDASDAFQYRWSPDLYLDDPTEASPIATPLEAITYTVNIFDAAGVCRIEKQITVLVLPGEDGRQADFEVSKDCGSTTINFTNTSTNATEFLWTFGDPSNPDFTSTEENPSYTYPDAGTYVATLTIPGDDCNFVSTKRLPVAGDDFVDFARTIDVCGPGFVVIDHGLNPRYTYQWEANPYFSDLTTALPDVFLNADASFAVTVTDPLNADCIISGTVDVTIGDQLVVDFDTASVFSCTGGDLALNPGGDPALIYSWMPADMVDDPSSANPTANVSETTTFVVTIADPNDASCSVRFKKTVGLGLDDGGFTDGDTIVACEGSTLFLNTGANTGLTYSWTPALYLDDPTIPNPIAAPEETITYTVNISDASGMCSTTKSITIIVVSSDVRLSFDVSKECASSTIDFTNTSVGATNFSWKFGDPTNPNFVSNEENPTYTFPPNSGTYEVELTSNDRDSCTAFSARRLAVAGEDFIDFADTIMTCDPRDIALNPDRPSGFIYQWAPDPSISDTTAANPLVDLKENRTFFVTVTDPINDTCQIVGSVAVFPDTRLVDSLMEMLVVCMPAAGETTALNPTGNPDFIYMWSPAELVDDPTSFNPSTAVTESTVFTVVITDPNDATCTVTREISLAIGDEGGSADILTSSPGDMLCPGDEITLIGNGAPYETLTWIDPNGDEIGTGDTISFDVRIDGSYQILGVVGECTFVDSFELDVRSLTFTLEPEEIGCPGEPVQINVTSNSEFLFDSVLWFPDGDILLGQGSESVVVRPDRTTSYGAMMFFADGCMAMDSVLVEVNDIEDRFQISAERDTIFFKEETTLSVTDEPGTIYQWSPADDAVSPTSPTTVVRPPATTTFMVSITDANDCMTVKEITIVVQEVNCNPPNIFLPNAFTPNADGENDILRVRGDFIEEIDFFIYNRWGQLVFESHNASTGWDGQFNGKELAPDVYGYHLRVVCIGGDEHIEQGNVTILR